MNAKKMNIVVSVFVLIAVFLTACGAETQATPAAEPATAAPTTVPTAVPTVDPKADWPTTFVMGFFGGDDSNKVLETNAVVAKYLAEKLGVEVEMVTGTSYSAVIEAMRAKKADAMQVGPFSYTLAVQEANAEALVASVHSKKDNPVYDETALPYYYSVIFVKKGSGIATLQDLKGKDFNFVDPASTSGHLMPKTLLIKNNINPDTDMKTVFAGSHPTSVISVWNDKAPAGATYEQNLYDLAADKQVDICSFPDGQTNKVRTPEEIKAVYDACPDGKLVIIAYTDPIPNTPFAVRADLPQSFKDAVKAALLDIKNHPEIIAQTSTWYVDPAPELNLVNLDAFYNPLRDIAKLLDLDLKAMK